MTGLAGPIRPAMALEDRIHGEPNRCMSTKRARSAGLTRFRWTPRSTANASARCLALAVDARMAQGQRGRRHP
jgi:hypothetical protein